MQRSDHEQFIAKAKEIAANSKDPSTKVGCIIVEGECDIVSDGYNGNVPGCDETLVPIIRPNKYYTIVHAEQHAVIRAKRDLNGCRAYVTDGPCEVCLKLLLTAGVKEIWYESPRLMRMGTPEQKAGIKALIQANNAQVKNLDGVDYLIDLESNS